jgi:phosphatidylethanolamine-binding protein (PEBP) family uncharacterized protein
LRINNESHSRAPANGPFRHYVFELFALDTKLDAQLTTDTFENRGNVIKAIQGHILVTPVYEGLFKRHSSAWGNWRGL